MSLLQLAQHLNLVLLTVLTVLGLYITALDSPSLHPDHIYCLVEYMFSSLCRAINIDPFMMFLYVVRHVDWSLRAAHAAPHPPPHKRLSKIAPPLYISPSTNVF
jgi:hypothetical protein